VKSDNEKVVVVRAVVGDHAVKVPEAIVASTRCLPAHGLVCGAHVLDFEQEADRRGLTQVRDDLNQLRKSQANVLCWLQNRDGTSWKPAAPAARSTAAETRQQLMDEVAFYFDWRD
jgi:hypothetical protein